MPRGKEFAQLPKSPSSGDNKKPMNIDALTSLIDGDSSLLSQGKKEEKH